MFDDQGNPTDRFSDVASIFVNKLDADGQQHGFDDVNIGSYLELFEETDQDFGLYMVTDIDDKTSMNPSYWIFVVDFVKSKSFTASAVGSARFKFFEITGGDISGYATEQYVDDKFNFSQYEELTQCP